jgi:hypothetical protein
MGAVMAIKNLPVPKSDSGSREVVNLLRILSSIDNARARPLELIKFGRSQ